MLIDTKRRSHHYPETLRQRYDLAFKFVTDFPIDTTIDVSQLDEWGVKAEQITAIGGPISTSDPAWTHRVRQRHEMVDEINLGGKCVEFEPHQRFQLVCIKRGRTYQIKQ